MRHEESVIQAEIVQALGLYGVFVFMVPNDSAGAITPAKAARLKAMGLRSGIPDLIVLGMKRKMIGLEVKTEDGKLSKVQQIIKKIFELFGFKYYVVRSVEEALTACRKSGILVEGNRRATNIWAMIAARGATSSVSPPAGVGPQ